MRMTRLTGRGAGGEVDSVYAWLRLLAGVLTSTIGGVGMWSIAVVLPTLQADFGVTRADVLLAYTAVMLGAVVGGPVMGWLSDRFGITVSVAIGTAMLALGLALLARELTDSLGKVNAAVNRIRRLKQGLSVLARSRDILPANTRSRGGFTTRSIPGAARVCSFSGNTPTVILSWSSSRSPTGRSPASRRG